MGLSIRSGPIPSTFGRDHKIRTIRRQCFDYQFFANVGTVRICCIDEIDAQLHGAAKNAYRRIGVLRRLPNSFAWNTDFWYLCWNLT